MPAPVAMTPSAPASVTSKGEKGEETFVADVIRGRLAPFSDPSAIAAEYAKLARAYGCQKVVGDLFAAEWVASAFRDAGARYEPSPLNRSSLYLEALPSFNQGSVSIPNQALLLRELRGLERRTHRSGRDTVDHGAHGSDDHANALCGCLYMAIHETRKPKARWGTYNLSGGDGRITWKTPEEEQERTRFNFVRLDEHGNVLTPEQARAIRRSLPGRRTQA